MMGQNRLQCAFALVSLPQLRSYSVPKPHQMSLHSYGANRATETNLLFSSPHLSLVQYPFYQVDCFYSWKMVDLAFGG